MFQVGLLILLYIKSKTIRELHKANGGEWGGIKVDYEFKRLLKDIMGRDILTELEQQHQSDYLDIFYSFERAKRISMNPFKCHLLLTWFVLWGGEGYQGSNPELFNFFPGCG